LIALDASVLAKVEAIVHPLVAADRASFIVSAKADIVVFDIPLLFETGGDTEMDATACVYIPDEMQEARVLERGTMTRDQFLAILANQMPSQEKCARADFVINTDTLDHARAQVHSVVEQIKNRVENARNRP